MTPEELERIKAQQVEDERIEYERQLNKINAENNQPATNQVQPGTEYQSPTDSEGNNTSGPETATDQAKEQLTGGITGEQVGDAIKTFTNISSKLQRGPHSIGQDILGQAVVDFASDAVGKIPGLGFIDDSYDEATKLENPTLQKLRESMAIILPSFLGGVAATKASGGLAAPVAVKGFAAVAGAAAIDVGVTFLSDASEKDETLLTEVDKMFPQLNIPDRLKTLDSDSPEVRREKNMVEAAGMSIVGEALGAAVSLGKPVFKWFKPLNKKADETLTKAKQTLMDQDTANEIDALDQVINDPETGEAAIAIAQRRRKQLIDQAQETGVSDATQVPFESQVARNADTRQMQIDEDALRALEADPEGVNFNMDISSNLAPEAATARQSIPPMNVARNMADVAAIKTGVAKGDPAPLITTPMMKKGLEVDGSARNIVQAIAEETREQGRFSAVVNGFRFTKEDMGRAAWKVYQDIMEAPRVEDVRQLFLSQPQARQVLADGTGIEYLNEVQATATGFAMRELVNRFLGREVTEASARVMDVLGREVATISEGAKKFNAVSDDTQIQGLVFDKLQFLMDEYATNKYIAGWVLNNKKWWKSLNKNADVELDKFSKQFDSALQAKKGANARLVESLKTAEPQMMEALIDAFARSDGDVTSIAKLMKWAETQVSPLGLVWSPKGGMTQFAQATWGIYYNNILSMLSASRAALGTAVGLSLKPINSLIGLGMESMMTGDMQYIKSGLNAYSAWATTNSRALKYAWNVWKKANVEPDTLIDRARRDFAVENEKDWSIIDAAASKWDENKDYGNMFMHSWAKLNYALAQSPIMRASTNAMVAIDAYNTSTMASISGRFEAYDKATKGGGFNPDVFNKAEKEFYDTRFNKDGLITDEAIRNASGEIALNLDTPAATMISAATSKLPLLKTVMAFPRTGVNDVMLGLSYTPIANIPGMGRYGKTLAAGDDIDKIKEALELHDIDTTRSTDDLVRIYKNIRAEYRGRQAFAAMLVGGLGAYAIDGSIRGNGPSDPKAKRELEAIGWKPNTVKMPGTEVWVEYTQLGQPFSTVLSIMGDLAYYARDLESPIIEDIHKKLAWTFAATFTNKTFVDQLEPFVQLVTGDEQAVTRWTGNTIRGFIPKSGDLSNLNKAIDDARKDIHNDLLSYVTSRLPGLSSTVPNQIDIWTGQPVRDADDPIHRIFNSISPIKVSSAVEPWRQALVEIGYDGISKITQDSTGQAKYPAEVREQINQMIGDQQPWKQVMKILSAKKYQDDLREIRQSRVQGYTSDEIRASNYPVFKELDNVLKEAEERAEMMLMEQNPDMARYIELGKLKDSEQKRGNTQEAKSIIDERRKLEQTLGISK